MSTVVGQLSLPVTVSGTWYLLPEAATGTYQLVFCVYHFFGCGTRQTTGVCTCTRYIGITTTLYRGTVPYLGMNTVLTNSIEVACVRVANRKRAVHFFS
jgi:hypothetical protein